MNKKFFLIIFGVVIVSVLLAACGNSNDTANTTSISSGTTSATTTTTRTPTSTSTTPPNSSTESNLNQDWFEPYVVMLEDGSKIAVVLEVKTPSQDDGLMFINYVIYQNKPNYEFVGFRYENPAKNLTFGRMIGGNVEVRIIGNNPVETDIYDPDADLILDEVKKIMNAEELVKEYIRVNQPAGWPTDWP